MKIGIFLQRDGELEPLRIRVRDLSNRQLLFTAKSFRSALDEEVTALAVDYAVDRLHFPGDGQ